MADIDYSMTVRFDGLDAEKHEIDLFSLGESLQGIARIAATVGHFAATERYSRYFKSHDVRVVAREPRANCFSLDVFWNYVEQYKILTGSFGTIVAVLIPYIFTRSSARKEEMKQIKDSLDKAIGELANRDQKTVDRLLDIVDRMAVDLRPAVRRSVAPIGETCRTMTFSSAERKDTFDEADKAAILRSEDDEITENRHFDISITELDLERGTCKTRMLGDAEDKRISAVITDPQLQQSNNPYSLAFAAGEAISVIAKALIKDGEVDRLFISDVAV